MLTLAGVILALFGYVTAAVVHWRRPEFWLLHVIILVSVLGHALAYGQGRYRVPWMPLMMIGALAGWREVAMQWRALRRPMIAAGAATFAIVLLGMAMIGRETRDIIRYQQATGRAQWHERRAAQAFVVHFNTLQFLIDQNKKRATEAAETPWPAPPPQ